MGLLGSQRSKRSALILSACSLQRPSGRDVSPMLGNLIPVLTVTSVIVHGGQTIIARSRLGGGQCPTDRQLPTDKQHRGVLVNTDFTRGAMRSPDRDCAPTHANSPTVECPFLASLEAIHLSGLLQPKEFRCIRLLVMAYLMVAIPNPIPAHN